MIFWCKHNLLRNFPTNGDSSLGKELLHPDEAGSPDKSLLDATLIAVKRVLWPNLKYDNLHCSW